MIICLADVQSLVAAPPSPRCETYQKRVGKLHVWAWRDAAFGSRDGWWVAITCSDIVLEAAWEMGDRAERDKAVAKLLASHLHLNADPLVSA